MGARVVGSAVLAASLAVLPLDVEAQTVTSTNGRIDRTIDVMEFDDFTFYLPDEAKVISIYAQWFNGQVVVVDDVTLLCLYGPDGVLGVEDEDDDLTFSNNRHTSYKVIPGKLWYTTTVSGQRCWLRMDFEHSEQYNRSASARFTIILSESGTTEGGWPSASSLELQMLDAKRQQIFGR